MVLVCSNMSRMGEQGSFLANSGGVFSVASDVQRIGEKVGAAGLEPQATSSSPLTDVNHENQDHTRNVISLEVALFNN